MRKATCHLGGVDLLYPRRWRRKHLHHHGGGVCWLFVLLWMDLWQNELIVCKKWYKNNLKMRLTALLSDPPTCAPYLLCAGWNEQLSMEKKTIQVSTMRMGVTMMMNVVEHRKKLRKGTTVFLGWVQAVTRLLWVNMRVKKNMAESVTGRGIGGAASKSTHTWHMQLWTHLQYTCGQECPFKRQANGIGPTWHMQLELHLQDRCDWNCTYITMWLRSHLQQPNAHVQDWCDCGPNLQDKCNWEHIPW